MFARFLLALTHAAGGRSVQAEDYHDQVRPGLVAMLPRLKRFADLLAGSEAEGRALLGRALNRMLAEQHRYQRGTALDTWAFGEIYRHWLMELREHAGPLGEIDADAASFEQLFAVGDGCDPTTVDYLRTLPPQHRLTLLLVYGEGFDYDNAAYVLDASPETVAGRLVKVTADLAHHLAEAALAQQETHALRAEMSERLS
jgi:DNA-directed RNA polymerase specialized sigma24 family protein